MSSTKDTIFALASGFGKAGVAVVRVSGNNALKVLTLLAEKEETTIKPRTAELCVIKTLDNKEILDKPIYIYFKAPHSYTGEDVLELHLHGGRAVIKAVLEEISKIEGLRPAEGGEFTRRAVLNDKMDLTMAEGIGDLIEASTFQQVRQALRQAAGELSDIYKKWRKSALHILAHIEAYIDFPEEEIPEDTEEELIKSIKELRDEINAHLSDNGRGQHLNEGYRIAIIGAPNAGKSSLLNRLVKKEAAIVSSLAGTTRDVIEVFMDIDGFPVIFSDTAGLREAENEIEQEGIKRALKRAENADLKLTVFNGEYYPEQDSVTKNLIDDDTFIIINKSDLIQGETPKNTNKQFFISAKSGNGIDELLNTISAKVSEELSLREEPALTKIRHREALTECSEALTRALLANQTDLRAEDLRLATRQIGVLTGRIDVEEVLDIVFKDFCIGK